MSCNFEEVFLMFWYPKGLWLQHLCSSVDVGLPSVGFDSRSNICTFRYKDQIHLSRLNQTWMPSISVFREFTLLFYFLCCICSFTWTNLLWSWALFQQVEEEILLASLTAWAFYFPSCVKGWQMLSIIPLVFVNNQLITSGCICSVFITQFK